jgi:multiple sugar transport system substrate-binding protein
MKKLSLAMILIFTATISASLFAAPKELTYWEMIWGPADSYTKTVNMLVDKYNATHPDVVVKVQMTPWDNFYNTFLTAVTSGAAPDISTGATPQPVQYAKMGEMLDLTSIIDQWKKEKNPILGEFPAGSLEFVNYKGLQAGLPWNLDPRQIVYRKDIFDKAGITKMPTTWSEFLDVCRKIKSKTDTIPFVFAAADQMGMQNMIYLMLSNGVGITDTNLTPTFTDKRVVEALQFVNTLLKENLIPQGTVGYKGSDADKVFYSGKAAMYLGGTPQQLYDMPDMYKVCGIMPALKGPSAKDVHILVWENSIMAYKQSKYPEESKAFIKWWLENNLQLWTEGKAGPLPVRKSFYKDSYFTSDWIKNEIGLKVIPYATSNVWPATGLYPAFSQIEGENILAIAMQDVLGGKTNYADIVKKVNDMVVKAMKQ